MKGESLARGCSTRPWTVWSAISTNRGHAGLRLCTNHWNPRSRSGPGSPAATCRCWPAAIPRRSASRSTHSKILDNAEQLDPVALVASIAPALQARTKGTIRLALQLLDRVAKRGAPSLPGSQAAIVAAEALVHEAPDIQGAVIDLIERHGDPANPELRALLVDRAGALAPSQRKRLESWLGPSPVQSSGDAGPSADIDSLIAGPPLSSPDGRGLPACPRPLMLFGTVATSRRSYSMAPRSPASIPLVGWCR